MATVLSSLVPHADLVVVSTDLSHYHDLERLDCSTGAPPMRSKRSTPTPSAPPTRVASSLRGAVAFARQASLSIRLLDLRTSGDTTGDPGRVVGYGAFVIER